MTLDTGRAGMQTDEPEAPDWLARAETIKRGTPEPLVYRHRKHASASAERVRMLAGVIQLDGPVPSTDIFES